MKAKDLKKLKKLLKQNKFSKLKSFLKKYEVNVNEILDEKQNTALHIACKYGYDAIAQLLIKKGAGCLASNADGNLPLHLACKFALRNRHAYTDLVLPLMKKCSMSLDVRNSQGVTARELLSEIKEQLQSQFQDDSSSCESEIEEADWTEKLAHEVHGEYEDMFGAYDNDYQFEGRIPDTYDNWADSMNKQYHQKNNQPHFASSRKRSHRTEHAEGEKKPKISDEKREEFAKKLQEEYKKQKEKETNEQRKESRKIYDLKCKAVFGPLQLKEQLRYKDIPWPFAKNCTADNVTSFLFSDLDPGSPRYKDYLRKQQIQWHPDRFMQKCRGRLVESDQEKIVNTVKEVSQILNALSDKS